jgi:hypothetical protein
MHPLQERFITELEGAGLCGTHGKKRLMNGNLHVMIREARPKKPPVLPLARKHRRSRRNLRIEFHDPKDIRVVETRNGKAHNLLTFSLKDEEIWAGLAPERELLRSWGHFN